jgi:hypothetical protein
MYMQYIYLYVRMYVCMYACMYAEQRQGHENHSRDAALHLQVSHGPGREQAHCRRSRNRHPSHHIHTFLTTYICT